MHTRTRAAHFEFESQEQHQPLQLYELQKGCVQNRLKRIPKDMGDKLVFVWLYCATISI